jgi:rhodanese-related sulfurtransferase
VSEVDLTTFARARTDDPEIIDVREPDEYVAGHVPGAKLIPMGQLPARLHEVQNEGPVYVLCASGNRSLAMTQFLRSAGYDAYSVAGGTGAWAQSGRPVAQGRKES